MESGETRTLKYGNMIIWKLMINKKNRHVVIYWNALVADIPQ